MPIVQTNFKQCVWQSINDLAFKFDDVVFFCHNDVLIKNKAKLYACGVSFSNALLCQNHYVKTVMLKPLWQTYCGKLIVANLAKRGFYPYLADVVVNAVDKWRQ